MSSEQSWKGILDPFISSKVALPLQYHEQLSSGVEEEQLDIRTSPLSLR